MEYSSNQSMELPDEYYVGKYKFKRVGQLVHKYPYYDCSVLICGSTWLRSSIAEVKQKSDGRWWWHQKSTFWEKWTVDKQGVAATMKEAMELAVKNYTNAE